ncbi:MAG TPA: hypothetical protein VMV46_08240 [Thermoanaerobaculia bacterium]|nr:hypothetical protein [Thermoanaerobaculia bacterium]
MTTQTTVTKPNGSPELADAIEGAGDAELRRARDRAQVALSAARETVDHGLGAAREKASALGTGIKKKATAARQRAEELGHDAKKSLQKGVETVKAGAVERYDGARKGAKKMARKSEDFVKEHPTGTVVGALAVGAAAGVVASSVVAKRRRRRQEEQEETE